MENKRKLVYADEFLNHVRCEVERANKVHSGQSGFVEWTENFAYLVDELLKDLPPVDAMKVVRCRDCKHRYTMSNGMSFCKKNFLMDAKDNDFCSCGAKNM